MLTYWCCFRIMVLKTKDKVKANHQLRLKRNLRQAGGSLLIEMLIYMFEIYVLFRAATCEFCL
jgi:hypothetical protein